LLRNSDLSCIQIPPCLGAHAMHTSASHSSVMEAHILAAKWRYDVLGKLTSSIILHPFSMGFAVHTVLSELYWLLVTS
jgi:hypothetical protein